VPRPAVIIDTSGSPERIKQALRRLDDLGTLVLTRAVGDDVSLNLYDDLHFRSLTIMGVMATSS
jgi:threonine dehydrogenase-like Zn-dependent dehydrogenase